MSLFATSPLPEEETTIIINSQFWPDIDLTVLRDAVRIDGTVTVERLTHAAVNAIAEVNGDLSEFRQEQELAGVNTLNDVPAETINQQSVLLHHYLRAVYCMTKASLIERYRDFDATGDGHKEADKLELIVDDLYRDARFAIRNITGQTHTTVALI